MYYWPIFDVFPHCGRPSSDGSKLFCVCYATVGIPLFLLILMVWTKVFKNLENLAVPFKKKQENLRVKISSENNQWRETEENAKPSNHSILKIVLRMILTVTLYFLIPALIIQKSEQKADGNKLWTFSEALYYSQCEINRKICLGADKRNPQTISLRKKYFFNSGQFVWFFFKTICGRFFINTVYCFITLTTIGYGDYMAEGSNLSETVRIFYYIFIEIWKIAGLVCVGLVMNRMAEKVDDYFGEKTDRIEATATDSAQKNF